MQRVAMFWWRLIRHISALPSKAKRELGWSHNTTLYQLVKEMVVADLAEMKATGRA
jgi:GDP-D-mannose dehydratase